MSHVDLRHGDCLAVMRELPDNSVDAVVCDPPYGLANTDPKHVADTIVRWVNGDRDYIPEGTGFMNASWDAFVPPVAVWDECLRVLKPGGHCLAFAGSRTMDLMTLGLRLAGFEIRDSIAWLYGSGFPKSLDVSKAIDKAAPRVGMFDAFAAHFWERWQASQMRRRDFVPHFPHYKNAESVMAQLSNWKLGKNVPSRRDFAILCSLLDMPSETWMPLIERIEAEREVIGQGFRVDRHEGHVNYGSGTAHGHYDLTTPATDAAKKWAGFGTAMKPGFEPVICARKPLAKGLGVAQNVQQFGTGALNIEATRIGTGEKLHGSTVRNDIRGGNYAGGHRPNPGDIAPYEQSPAGRWPANVALSSDQAAALDQMSGISVSRKGKPRGAASGEGWGMTATGAEYDDQGGASRYFLTAEPDAPDLPIDELAERFMYCAKAPKSERPTYERADDGPTDSDNLSRRCANCGRYGKDRPANRCQCAEPDWSPRGKQTVSHPTVKPLALMRWLVRLVTPPGGTVLEPFAGSGATVEAAILEGFNIIAIEREADYLPLIQARIFRAQAKVAAAEESVEPPKKAKGRWPANVALDEESAEALDVQSGERKSSGVYDGDGVLTSDGQWATDFGGGSRPASMYADSGGASRYFFVAKSEPAPTEPEVWRDGAQQPDLFADDEGAA